MLSARMKHRTLSFLAFLVALFVAGRGSESTFAAAGQAGGSITSVSVACTPASITVKQTSTCQATVKGTGKYSSVVTWKSSQPNDWKMSPYGVFFPAPTLDVAATPFLEKCNRPRRDPLLRVVVGSSASPLPGGSADTDGG